MRIAFMFVSIVAGNFVGAYVSSFIGFGGALVGAFIVGVAVYYIYSLLSGQPTSIIGAVVFGILNYVSTMITGYIGSMTGFATGILALFVQVLVLAMLWGWIGGKAQKGAKSGLTI